MVWTTRRLARHTRLSFDLVHGVDTLRSTANEAGPAVDAGRAADIADYEAVSVKHFRFVMRQIPLPFERWSLIDIGSGKGRAVLLAMALPFRKVAGVELFDRLHATALSNLERYRGPRLAGTVELRCGDALTAALPEGDTVVFFYNSLRGALLEGLLDRLERSVASSPRRLLFAYSNPVERERVDRRPAFWEVFAGASGHDLVWWGNRRVVIYALGDWSAAESGGQRA